MYIITGCAGFIGSHVAKRLLESGEQVLGIDSIDHSSDPRLKRWRIEPLLRHSQFKMFNGDITDTSAIQSISRRLIESGSRPTAMINMAGQSSLRSANGEPHPGVDVNINGTLNLLELCRKHRIKKFVSASSANVYGNSSIGPADEAGPTDQPLSIYAASHKSAELLAHGYHHMHGLDVSMLRFFTVYGPAGRPDMSVLRFARWIANGDAVSVYGDGSQERDYIYIDDVSRGVMAAVKLVGFETFNLGTSHPVTVKGLISTIESAIGRTANIVVAPVNLADVKSTWANVAKARRILGWEPRISLEEGIKATIAWYMANREMVDALDLGMESAPARPRKMVA